MFLRKIFCFFCFISCVGASDLQYIIYAIPVDDFENSLNTYWSAVRNSDLNHKAISKYPPHCTLTSFFDPDLDVLPDPITYYDNAIVTAINQAIGTPTVRASTTIVTGRELDYIKLTSSFLQDLAGKYIDIADIADIASAKGQPGDKMPFHITLREHVYAVKSKLPRIRSLQNKIFIPSGPQSGWLICLFKCENDVMTMLTSHPLPSP